MAAAVKSHEEELDKTRGFVKYHRQKIIYRPPEQRLNDWEEVSFFGQIYFCILRFHFQVVDYQSVRSNIREQAARCMDCGIPFCQSKA